MLHVHEPLAPGPSMTTRHAARRTDRRHVPRRRALDELPAARAGAATAARTRRPPGRRLEGRARRSCRSTSAARRRVSAVQRCRDGRDPGRQRRCPRRGRRSSSSAATRSARVSPCCSQAMRLLDVDVACWVAGDGPDTARLRIEHGGDPRIEWLGRIIEADKFAAAPRRLGVLRAVAARRVVRRRADRGDGGRHARGRQRARRLPQRGHRRASTPCSSSPATPTSLAAAPEPRARATATSRDVADRPTAADAPTSSRCRASPTRTWPSTRTARSPARSIPAGRTTAGTSTGRLVALCGSLIVRRDPRRAARRSTWSPPTTA